MRNILSTELSDRETHAIGSIVSHWGFLEAEIFEQTLLSFGGSDELPPAMKSNAQFSSVLKLWRERVVENQDAGRRAVLIKQHEKLESLSDFRQAVVHSRWEWKPDSPDEIVAVRVHKQEIKRVRFTFDDLLEFSMSLGELRFWIRYPGGLEDRAKEMTEQGGHMSRLGWDLLSGRKTLDEVTKLDSDK